MLPAMRISSVAQNVDGRDRVSVAPSFTCSLESLYDPGATVQSALTMADEPSAKLGHGSAGGAAASDGTPPANAASAKAHRSIWGRGAAALAQVGGSVRPCARICRHETFNLYEQLTPQLRPLANQLVRAQARAAASSNHTTLGWFRTCRLGLYCALWVRAAVGACPSVGGTVCMCRAPCGRHSAHRLAQLLQDPPWGTMVTAQPACDACAACRVLRTQSPGASVRRSVRALQRRPWSARTKGLDSLTRVVTWMPRPSAVCSNDAVGGKAAKGSCSRGTLRRARLHRRQASLPMSWRASEGTGQADSVPAKDCSPQGMFGFLAKP